MEQQFKKTISIVVLSTVLFGISACAVTGNNNNTIDNEGDSRRVGKVVWDKQVDVNIDNILDQSVPNDNARLILMRKKDTHPEQTSANVSINNRFQVSLQAGNFTVVNSCLGLNQISAHATKFKNNDLLADKETYQLASGQTYFFYVDMDADGQSTIEQLTPDSARARLAHKRYQAHQVSRVTPDCSMLAAPVAIDLEILFDTDKAIVLPQYYPKIAEVAEFMTQYANTETIIEGHTDDRGSDSYNQALSQRRVDAVRQELITRFGIDADRVQAIGYGESQPRASNDDEAGRQLNRRVVSVVKERSAK